MKKSFSLLLLFLISVSYSQNSYFDDGFINGFNKYIQENGNEQISYINYLQRNDCNKKTYFNDPKVKEKLYSDGYACGTAQAVKALLELKNKRQTNNSNKKNNGVRTIQEIESEIQELEKKRESLYGQQADAISNQILSLEIEKKNIINRLQSERQNQINSNENNDSQIIYQNQKSNYDQNTLKQLQENNRINNDKVITDFSNSLNQLSNQMQNAMLMQIYNNLKYRENLINNFSKQNQQKLEKINTFYNSIPKENFKKNLNGMFKAYFISNKKYSYAPDYELLYVEDCYVEVKNNIITNVFMFGNKELESNLPKSNPENSGLNYGIAKYFNLENLETYTVVIIEPYLKNTESVLTLKENNVGYITVWSSDKDDEGKIIYIQELYDNYTKMNREIAVRIQYAKNEKEIKAKNDVIKVPFNLNYTIFYLGEVTNTPYGRIPLAPKVSNPKENNKELKANEHRFVEIKKYRE